MTRVHDDLNAWTQPRPKRVLENTLQFFSIGFAPGITVRFDEDGVVQVLERGGQGAGPPVQLGRGVALGSCLGTRALARALCSGGGAASV